MAEEKDPRTTSLVGRTIQGKWQLEHRLGTGGMASVWSARHRNGKRVAIKLLHRELAGDEYTRKRFLREGYLANKVDHPGVVTISDDDAEDDLVFLVMELLEGQTLGERWKKNNKRLDLATVLRVTDEVLDVLVAAHEKEIVHRDIKPANIFLTNDGGVKVLDFGIARLKEGAASTGMTTRLGTALGSPAFMSPEQARARWEFVDARTDLWAMGAVMFSMLSGQFVHGMVTASEMIIATATRPARSLQEVWPEAPDVVAAIVDRALAYERADRWQDARSMQVAVRRAMQIDFAKPRQMLPSMLDLTDVDPAPVPRTSKPPSIGSSRPPPRASAPDLAANADEPVLGRGSSPSLSTSAPGIASAPPPSAGTTTSAPVAAPEPASSPPRPAPEQRSMRSTAVLGLFIALGLSIGGVAIGTLSRRTVIVSMPAPPPPPIATTTLPEASASPAAATASATSMASAAPPAAATSTASAAPPPTATAASNPRGPKKKPPKAPPPPPPPKGKFSPSGI